MEITLLQIVLVFIVACIAGMESVLDEFQFHRPLVACTLIGAVLGDMKTGIIIGGTLEMIALGWMNIGAAVAPDAALASIISTVLVIAGHQSIGAGIALAIPLAAAGQVLTIIVRTITVAFQHAADDVDVLGAFAQRLGGVADGCVNTDRATAQRLGERRGGEEAGDAPVEALAGEHGQAGGAAHDRDDGAVVPGGEQLDGAQSDEAACADNGETGNDRVGRRIHGVAGASTAGRGRGRRERQNRSSGRSTRK